MMRAVRLSFLAGLWALWAYWFVEVALAGYALSGSALKALTPEVPRFDWTIQDLAYWIGAMAVMYGPPILLAFLTWRSWPKRKGNELEQTFR